MLEVRLFGTFELRSDGTPVALTSSRAQSLLATGSGRRAWTHR